ncbi:hypothetical protein SKAU_G00357450 [Synaphobranchus kaupii]|uniref:Uncharacterized protein n=1 Tax=Synaphobranchus kaupii TaxID=118154 RepID=A0A9Q1EHJ6_SYNKA|nr:hypothetical protein SKAU_G00357450 [Synaphobranchus kaupii]
MCSLPPRTVQRMVQEGNHLYKDHSWRIAEVGCIMYHQVSKSTMSMPTSSLGLPEESSCYQDTKKMSAWCLLNVRLEFTLEPGAMARRDKM